jgi:hypothetical protein
MIEKPPNPVPPVLEKHIRYGNSYGKSELYWGLGIECESYFEMSKPVDVVGRFILDNQKRERYSVDYYTSYKQPALTNALSNVATAHPRMQVPMLVNAHAFTKMNKFGEHKTLYKKGAPPNPSFVGQTLFERLQLKDPEFFKDQYETKFTFDGDSIEIMTQDFYRATVKKVVAEFIETRRRFLDALQKIFTENQYLSEYGTIQWAQKNHGFAVMATNPSNTAIFNNGTYHINITLPTMLNDEGKIANFMLFEQQHRAMIRAIQWLEPMLVGAFGSADILASVSKGFSVGSQRGAMSRYIGIGTYDTNKMEKGKLLAIPIADVRSTWYKDYHADSSYNALTEVGFDINFNKHWNHGIEIRFFDWFPEGRLSGLLRMLVYLADVAVDEIDIVDPLSNKVWNAWMVRVIQKGAAAGVTSAEALLLTKVFSIPCRADKDLNAFFADFYCTIAKKWKGKGPCSRHFLSDEVVVPTPSPINQTPVESGGICMPSAPREPAWTFRSFVAWLFGGR